MTKRRSTSKKSDRRLLVITSDWHASHKLGLMNPETVLYEQRIDGKGKAVVKENDYTLGEFQRYLKKVKKGTLTRREGLNHARYHSILYKYVEDKEP